jgi:hypothetical protein
MAKLSPEIRATLSQQKEQLMNGAITNIQNRLPALERSLEEIKLDWRLK